MTGELAAALDRLARDYWEGVLERDPALASFFGDHRYRDRLPDPGPEGRAAEASALAGVLRKLRELEEANLGPNEQVTYEMLRTAAENGVLGLALGLEQLAVDQLSGPQIWLAELVGWHRLADRDDVDALLLRFARFGRYVDEYIRNLRHGLDNGRSAHVAVVARVIGQLEGILETPASESQLVPRGRVSEGDAGRIKSVIGSAVYPAYQRLLTFLADEYQPQARTEPGLLALRGGAEIYAYLVRVHTTTDVTPDALHRIGLEELVAVEDEARRIGERMGLSSGLAEIVAHLNRLPDNLPADRASLIVSSEELLRRVEAILPRAFGMLPKIPCLVKPIEEFREKDAPGAFYYPPADDGSRPGVFYVNTFRPETRPLHGLPALVAHEGLPGHHLQIALAQEMEDLPTFRRLSSGCTAYVEGWALYSERLADELGLYRDDRDRIGMLQNQAWRAVRLVVDTGLHHFGWQRERAIQFFQEHVGAFESEAAVEVDRYITWPGQALAYKTGQRVIEQLRREAAEAMGEGFDLRSFHDEVLRHGPVPLSTLSRTLRRWIRERGRQAQLSQ